MVISLLCRLVRDWAHNDWYDQQSDRTYQHTMISFFLPRDALHCRVKCVGLSATLGVPWSYSFDFFVNNYTRKLEE